MMKHIGGALFALLLFSAPAWAACDIPKPINRPFTTAPNLDTMTSDFVKIIGGCLDATPIGQNTPAAGTFTTLSATSLSATSLGLPGGTTNGLVYFDGTKLTNGPAVTWNGSLLTLGGGLGATVTSGSVGTFASGGPTDWTSHLVHDSFRVAVNGFPITAEFGNNSVPIASAIVGGIDIPANAAGSAAGQAVAGYARTLSTTVGAVGVMGVGLIGVNNGTAAWQFNGITSNAPCPNPGVGSCAAESGFDSPYLFGWEGDFNIVYKVGHVVPTTALDAILLTGGSTVQPSAGSNAFHLGLLGVTIDLPWTRGLYFDNGAAITAIELGTLAVSGASASQPILLHTRDLSAVTRNTTITANSDGDLLLTAGSGLITASRTNITYSDTSFNGALISNTAVNAQAWGRLDIRTAAFSGLMLAQLGTSGNVRIWNQSNTTLSFGTNNADVLTFAATGIGTFASGPLAPTAALNTNTTQLATTAFVTSQVSGAARSNATPANPAGRANTVQVMAGLAGTITPATTGRVLYTISGTAQNNTNGDGCIIQLRHGTGAAPSNAAAVTGTTDSAAQTYVWATAAAPTGWSIPASLTGLSTGTAVWLDVSFAAVTGGTCTLANITVTALET